MTASESMHPELDKDLESVINRALNVPHISNYANLLEPNESTNEEETKFWGQRKAVSNDILKAQDELRKMSGGSDSKIILAAGLIAMDAELPKRVTGGILIVAFALKFNQIYHPGENKEPDKQLLATLTCLRAAKLAYESSNGILAISASKVAERVPDFIDQASAEISANNYMMYYELADNIAVLAETLEWGLEEFKNHPEWIRKYY